MRGNMSTSIEIWRWEFVLDYVSVVHWPSCSCTLNNTSRCSTDRSHSDYIDKRLRKSSLRSNREERASFLHCMMWVRRGRNYHTWRIWWWVANGWDLWSNLCSRHRSHPCRHSLIGQLSSIGCIRSGSYGTSDWNCVELHWGGLGQDKEKQGSFRQLVLDLHTSLIKWVQFTER